MGVFVADDDPVFDADKSSGKIADPVALASTGPLPRNGRGGSPAGGGDGSGGGCTVGSTPAYDLLFLLLGLGMIAAIRIWRGRGNA